jgi:hypothetical protein
MTWKGVTMTFSDRLGYSAATPPRIHVERDSDALRLVLWKIVTKNTSNYLAAYHRLSEHAQQLPESSIWSQQFAEEPARALLEQLSWIDVYEALEQEYTDASKAARVQIQRDTNRALARGGLAYEMRDGKFEFYEPAATELDVRHDEDAVVQLLDDEFAAVRKQYLNSLGNLRSLPPDLEGAVGDALNSLEAVAKIVTGDLSATLSSVAPKLFPDSPGYHAPLRLAIEKLYAYSNQLPGSRHGRYAEPVVAHAESVMVVRLAGAIMTFLITLHRSQHNEN